MCSENFRAGSEVKNFQIQTGGDAFAEQRRPDHNRSDRSHREFKRNGAAFVLCGNACKAFRSAQTRARKKRIVEFSPKQ